MIAAARLLEPSPTGPLSSTTIRPPRRLSARWYAVLRPVTPAPMITVVGSAILFRYRIGPLRREGVISNAQPDARRAAAVSFAVQRRLLSRLALRQLRCVRVGGARRRVGADHGRRRRARDGVPVRRHAARRQPRRAAADEDGASPPRRADGGYRDLCRVADPRGRRLPLVLRELAARAF